MFQLFVALALAAAAAITDYLYYRIPNMLVALGMVTLVWIALTDAWYGEMQMVFWRMQGMGISLILLIPVYLFGGLGAGDVKLLCIIGGLFGVQSTVIIIAAAFCIGAGYGIGTILKGIQEELQRYQENGVVQWHMHRIHFAYAVFGATLIYGLIMCKQG